MLPLIIIQGRIGSRRLPGKVDMLIGTKRMIDHVVDRCVQTGWAVEVAMAEAFRDIPHEDVLSRYARCARIWGPEYDPIVRVTSDCPLWDSGVAQQVMSAFNGFYTTTTLHWDGLDVEVMSREALLRADLLSDEREHVTTWMRRQQRASWVTLPMCLDWSIDTHDDLDWVRRVMAACPHCMAGVPWHTNAPGSIGGAEGRHPVFDLHVSTGGGLTECQAYDILKERITYDV